MYNVFVEVTGQYRGKVLGLCGNFNGQQNDDFKTIDNQVASNAALFGNSWKAESSCPDIANAPDTCKSVGWAAHRAKRQCFFLRNPPFNRCNNILNPNIGYIPNCLYDVCACEGNPTACLCEAYAAYSEDCRAAGVLFDWRKLYVFRLCSKYHIPWRFTVTVYVFKTVHKDLMHKLMGIQDLCPFVLGIEFKAFIEVS